MNRFVDLHMHSFFSDGLNSPEELVIASKRAGLSAISVVDHDTVAGIDEVKKAGFSHELEIIPGAEFTADNNGKEIHILGYCIDHTHAGLQQKLLVLKQSRIDRIYEMSKRLKAVGVTVPPEDVFAEAKNATVGRMHMARVMVKRKICMNTTEAFRNFIGDHCSSYVLGLRFNPQEVIAMIHEAGGVAVIAHPYTIHNDDVLLELVAAGVNGVEALYPEHSQAMINFYLGFAKQHKLLVTGGSDFHGDSVGHSGIGDMKVEYEYVEALKNYYRG